MSLNSTLHLRLHPSVHLLSDNADLLIAHSSGSALRQSKPSSAVRSFLQHLAETGGSTEELISTAKTIEPEFKRERIDYLLFLLHARAWLSYGLRQGTQILTTLVPMASSYSHMPVDLTAKSYRLSRFAWMRREGDTILLECGLGESRLILNDERIVTAVGLLTCPQNPESLATSLPGLTTTITSTLITLLANAKVAFQCNADGLIPEDVDPILRQWEYHDLMFHSRSRLGRQDYPMGSTFRFAEIQAHAPALKSASGGGRVALPMPDLMEAGPGIFSVIEMRRSIRDANVEPLTLEQLGCLLWNVCRVKSHHPSISSDVHQYETTHRPVASAGAMHELEFYLTVSQCADLKSALYRYDPMEHQLECISETNKYTDALLSHAMRCAGLESTPDALITLTARFERMNWKYQGMSYAATLKNVGAVYQQIYLVATALGIAPCALGAGDSDLFAAAIGANYYEEASVGEFLLSGSNVVANEYL